MSILLVAPRPEVSALIGTATGGAVAEIPGPVPNDPARVLALSPTQGHLEVVLLDATSGRVREALHLAAAFDRAHPDLSVLLIADQDSVSTTAAMRAGVRDVLAPDTPLEEVRVVLDRALQVARTRALHRTGAAESNGNSPPFGRLIGVVSPKGGVGKTTVATNLAVGLAQCEQGSTVLVDLDLQFGDVASALGLEPEYCLPDAIRGRGMEDSLILKTYLTEHSSGLYVLCGPQGPAEADEVRSEDVRALLDILAGEFRYVVVDTAPGLLEHTLTALDRSTDLVFVTGMDVPGVRGLRKELDTLDSLSMMSASRQVIVNLDDKQAGMTVLDVEAAIGGRVALSLPRHKSVLTSVNQGVPLLTAKGKDPVSKGLRDLVQGYLPAAAVKKQSRWLMGRHRNMSAAAL
ncbi:MAG: AAA family ATPase [Actinobacteria bacterium]|uniref:AAA family ATPase n=1 Tax=Ornithinimicrobium sp. TaxID=1977084 RepID=UPI00183F3AD6|nr:AAA family ATPase [Actinomycetota bacterium]